MVYNHCEEVWHDISAIENFQLPILDTNMEINARKCCFSSKRLESMCNSKFSTVKHALKECVMSFSY